MNISKKLLSVAAVGAAISLTACSTPASVSFKSPRPWQDGTGSSYEKLEYAVTVYNTENGSGEAERVAIASGKLGYTLEENTRADGAVKYSSLAMAFDLTYNQDAPEKDRGKTDKITSSLEFQTDSLAASTMEKSVELAPRDDLQNLSYKVTADYFNEHSATRIMTGIDGAAEERMSISSGTFYDNEAMYYLARATDIDTGASPNFYMTNIFDSFVKGGVTTYTMVASCAGDTVDINIGDWVYGYGVEPTTAENGDVSYPVKCIKTSIAISDAKQGPANVVYYSASPFKKDDVSHGNIPVMMTYDQYTGSALTRVTEYKLVSCAFAREA